MTLRSKNIYAFLKIGYKKKIFPPHHCSGYMYFCLYHTGKEWSFVDCQYATEDNGSLGRLYSIETDLLPCPEVKWFQRFMFYEPLWTVKISLAP